MIMIFGKEFQLSRAWFEFYLVRNFDNRHTCDKVHKISHLKKNAISQIVYF